MAPVFSFLCTCSRKKNPKPQTKPPSICPKSMLGFKGFPQSYKMSTLKMVDSPVKQSISTSEQATPKQTYLCCSFSFSSFANFLRPRRQAFCDPKLILLELAAFTMSSQPHGLSALIKSSRTGNKRFTNSSQHNITAPQHASLVVDPPVMPMFGNFSVDVSLMWTRRNKGPMVAFNTDRG